MPKLKDPDGVAQDLIANFVIANDQSPDFSVGKVLQPHPNSGKVSQSLGSPREHLSNPPCGCRALIDQEVVQPR